MSHFPGDDNSDTTYSGGDLEILSALKRYRKWIMVEMAPYLSGAAVEIGAGIGSFTKDLRRHCASLEVIEPSPNLHRRLLHTHQDDDRIDLHCMNVEAWLEQTESASRDTLVMINVLEHIENDSEVLAELFRVLRPGGHLLVFVPAMMALFSKIDALHGHFRRYGRQDLTDKASRVGFQVLEAKYLDVLGALPWLVINKWFGQTEFKPGMIRLYDRVGVPLTRAVERHIRFPFGKNVLMVARRQ